MKDKLQQELLAKIKPGMKPSDLKKPKRIIKPKPQKDDGYESSGSDKSIPTAPPLPNSQLQDLKNQITALQKQLQLYKDFREGDLKVKEDLKKSLLALTKDNEKLKEENANLKEAIAKLDSLLKQKQEVSVYVNEPTETKTFTCSECNQTKPQAELSRVFGKFSFCLECSKQARQMASQQKQPPIEEFICHLCAKGKKEVPVRMKLDQTLTEYLVCQECRPHAKEFNEADLITGDLWEKYPYSSASEILELEFGIVPNKKPW